jgi:epoxide hydrolase-like predicted phosphatase
MIKLIIFDVGGVIDTFDEVQYIKYITQKLALDPKEFARTLIPLLDDMEIGKMGIKEAKRILSAKFKVSEHALEWESAFRKLNTVNKDVVNLINRLSKKYKIAILTNVSRSRHEIKMEMYLKKVKFDEMFVSCYIKMHKPEHRIYRFVLKKMMMSPQESLFVDNLKVNTNAAKEVGMHAIQFKNYTDLVKRLRKLGVK